jgi:hypothetical protein
VLSAERGSARARCARARGGAVGEDGAWRARRGFGGRLGAGAPWQRCTVHFLGRRTDVVGIFPDDQSLIRLASMIAIETNDEWLVGRSYMAKGTMGLLSERATQRTTSPTKEIPQLSTA